MQRLRVGFQRAPPGDERLHLGAGVLGRGVAIEEQGSGQGPLLAGRRGLHADLLAGIAEHRALGRELRPLGVVPRHRPAGRREQLPDRRLAVLVEVGVGVSERLGEVLREDGGVLLRAGVGGGDDDASLGGQRFEEGRARLGGVDDDDTAGQGAEHHGPIAGRQVGPDQVELRLVAVERAVPEQHHQRQVVLRHLAAQRGERLAHVLGRGRRTGGARRLIDELDDLPGREAEPLASAPRRSRAATAPSARRSRPRPMPRR